MLDWIRGWSLAGWALAIAGGIAVMLTFNHIFGAEVLRTWVEAIWGARQ